MSAPNAAAQVFPPQAQAVQHLIVTGVARSGTTSLAECLNSHPAVCVGIERFKFRFLLEENYGQKLFEKKRFFDFRPKDTNLRPQLRPAWAPVYEAMEARWDDALVRGDKVPDLIPNLSAFLAANPTWRCICTLRNLKDVALSWQKRANRKGDAWPLTKDFAAGCESWSAQMDTLMALLRAQPLLRQRILLVDYDRMYEDGSVVADNILRFLGLPDAPSYRATFEGQRQFFARRSGKETTVPEVHRAAYSAVDQTSARGLRREARLMAERWAALPLPVAAS